MRLLFLIISLLISFYSFSQEVTLGLISYNVADSYQGYTMIYPHNQADVFLLNNCGEIVHTWEDEDDFRPGNVAYLLADGSLVKAKRASSVTNDAIWAGGGGAIIEIRSWENELLWSYELNDENARLHHDIEVLPNGNILMIAWESKSAEEAIAAGRDTNLISQQVLWPDFIQEVDPNTDEIVWEWHAWDHLVQDFDSTKANYGIVSDFPGRINLNYQTNNGAADWMHSNAIDYNAELDHIMICVPFHNEILIIDHSTTTEEARTDSGGTSNRGGELLYRVGNPIAYNREDAGDQILFNQHDAHWANEFLPQTHPDFGKIVVFNNEKPTPNPNQESFSAVETFQPPWVMYSGAYEQFQGTWPPYELENSVVHPDTVSMHSTGLSSAQLLPNGNKLITAGRRGYTFELTPDNEIVWEYITPRIGPAAAEQGTILSLNQNLTFRSFRYPIDFEAFEGRDLSPKGFLEINPVTDWCNRLVSTSTPAQSFSLIFPNPSDNMIHLSWDSGKIIDIEVFNLAGQRMIHEKGNGGMKYLDVSDLTPGIYLITLDGKNPKRLIKG